MSWGFGNCGRLKSISTYKQAKEHFEWVTPIRGRKEEVKPLGLNRRYTWYRIKENMRVVDDGCLGAWQKTYSANLYNTDMVEWFPNGDIAIGTGGWQSPTSLAFINYTTQDFGHIESWNGKWYFTNKESKSYLLKSKTKEKLLLVNTRRQIQSYARGMVDVYEPAHPQQEHKYSANRKEMNRLKKYYAPFTEYCKNMLLIDKKFNYTSEEIDKAFGKMTSPHMVSYSYHRDIAKEHRSFFMEKVGEFIDGGSMNLNLAYNLALLGAKSAAGWRQLCEPKQFEDNFIEIIKNYHNEEVFKAAPMEVGIAFVDRNAKYFY
jgi:hypothetical protein